MLIWLMPLSTKTCNNLPRNIRAKKSFKKNLRNILLHGLDLDVN